MKPAPSLTFFGFFMAGYFMRWIDSPIIGLFYILSAIVVGLVIIIRWEPSNDD